MIAWTQIKENEEGRSVAAAGGRRRQHVGNGAVADAMLDERRITKFGY
jgi:hypothetical protein